MSNSCGLRHIYSWLTSALPRWVIQQDGTTDKQTYYLEENCFKNIVWHLTSTLYNAQSEAFICRCCFPRLDVTILQVTTPPWRHPFIKHEWRFMIESFYVNIDRRRVHFSPKLRGDVGTAAPPWHMRAQSEPHVIFKMTVKSCDDCDLSGMSVCLCHQVIALFSAPM